MINKKNAKKKEYTPYPGSDRMSLTYYMLLLQ